MHPASSSLLTVASTDAEMTEIVFVVERSPEGGLTTGALGESISTEADTEAELRVAVQDAVHRHLRGVSPAFKITGAAAGDARGQWDQAVQFASA
jgi:hypothetical protein